MPTEKTVDVRGHQLHIQRAGSGEPVLFLHGVQGLAGWEPGLAELAGHFDVIAPDHPGFGRSGAADGFDDVGELALFYLDALKALDLDSVHVVGHCLGGWIALELAIRCTARVKTLSLVGSAGLRLKGVPRADMFLCSAEELPRLLFANGAAEAWTRSWHGDAALEELYDRNRVAAARFTWQPRLCNPKLEKWLHRIDVPTHIVWGEQDQVIPPAYAEALRDRIAGASVTMLPSCGHLPHYEQPKEFAATVSNFIRGAAR
jgi:pimeloyl-ACP methyl ester carboxylesterase